MSAKGTSSQRWYGLLSAGLATTVGGAAYIYHQNQHDLFSRGNMAFASDAKRHAVFSWGASGHGQLGLGQDSSIAGVTKPTAIPELDEITIRQMDAFHSKTALVTEDGQLVVWGSTRDGSMLDGQGHTFRTNATSPEVFEEKDGVLFQQVACGKDHIAAITQDGRLLTLGNSDKGKLGHKEYLQEMEDRKKPGAYRPSSVATRSRLGYVEIQDEVDGNLVGRKVIQVACGFRHTACIAEDGSLWTWGDGRNGQLGHDDFSDQFVPKKVPLSSKATKVGCGANFTVVMDEKGKLYAFGDNRYGQLGIRGLENIVLNHPQGIATSLKKVSDFSVGEDHAAYLDVAGGLYTWGNGGDGQLGHGDTSSAPAPKKLQLADQKVLKVACGGGHTAYITDKNELWLCGRGRDGQLGRGDQLESVAFRKTSPVKVPDVLDTATGKRVELVDVALGTDHTILLANK